MTTSNLAKIERVELREAWPNEARDFTPWLAENIAELGEALGMDLELQQTEASVGGYWLDVLATELNQNRPVIIENQLDSTDHSHLGQLMTYAAGFDANVIIWLAREFRDEHRQAIDWLNGKTDEDTEFFGVVVELLRIDDSRLAPQFKAVAAPNGWRKESAAKARRGSLARSDRGERYRSFFQKLIDVLREEHNFTKASKAQPDNWHNFSSDYSGVHYTAVFNSQQQAAIQIGIERPDADWNLALFRHLESFKSEIEIELGLTLDWQPREGRKSCQIVLYRPGSIDDGDLVLSEIRDWMIQNLLNFKKVLGPRLWSIIPVVNSTAQEQSTVE